MSFRKNKISSGNYSKTSSHERLRQKTNRYGIDDNNNKNYDHLLSELGVENEQASLENITEPTKNATADNSNNIHLMSSVIVEMRAIIKLLTEKLKGLSTEVRGMQQSSVLNIGQNEITDEELPQLKKFEAFKLPINNQQDLESLETYLKTDESFHIFFVSFI